MRLQHADAAPVWLQVALGVLHQAGRGVQVDIPAAMRLFTEAAAAGNARAQNELGCLLATGWAPDAAADARAALHCFTQSARQARQSLLSRQVQVPEYYLERILAFLWDIGNPKMQLQGNLAALTNLGRAVEATDAAAAGAMYRAAAAAGYGPALSCIARLCLEQQDFAQVSIVCSDGHDQQF